MTLKKQNAIQRRKYDRLVQVFTTPKTRDQIKHLKGKKTYDTFLRDVLHLDDLEKNGVFPNPSTIQLPKKEIANEV